jgi:alpha-glucosidase
MQLMADYAGSGDKVHMCYGFDFLGPNCTPLHFKTIIEKFETGAGGAWPCWAFSNHDCIRHVSRWTRPGEDPAQVAKFAAALLLSLRGSLCLYQGEELGLTEADLSFDQLKDPAGITFWPEYKGRDGCRTPMPWDAGAENAGFGTGTPWLPVEAAHLPMAVSRQEADAGSVLNFYRKAIGIRQRNAALKTGSVEVLEASEDVLALRREAEGGTVMCVYNFGSAQMPVPKKYGTDFILLSGNGVTIEPRGFIWLRT